MKNEKQIPITVYISGAFGVHKELGYLLSFGTDKYAQYDRSPFVRYIPKGKRKPTGCRVTSTPYLLVLLGHGYPDPADPFTDKTMSGSGCMVSKSRYSSFDDRYKTDFDQVIDKHLKGITITIQGSDLILMDVRHTVGTNFLKEHAMRDKGKPGELNIEGGAPVLKQYDY